MASSSPANVGRSDFKHQVLAATDIVQLIGGTVALKKKGKDFWGLCPFHSEKSGSFKVDPVKQYYYCFGCKENGNAIDFVIKRDRLEFIDALKLLAESAGLEMPQFGVSKEKSGERQALFDANAAATMFFEKQLAHPQAGAAARAYLEQRGFSAETVKQFRIGLAIESWDALLRSPLLAKVSPEILFRAGLVKARDKGNGHYDTFRNRLMFPIRDPSGRTIAFGGRIMPGSQEGAKYLNSPETPLFNKSECLYGLDLAQRKIMESQTVAVVEGYTDVVMAHQHGASNVVAILGTGMTEGHLKKLRMYAEKPRIVLLFDPDAAGDKAVKRVVELFLGHDLELAIASMPEGVDPDEFLMQQGLGAFEKVLADATDVLSYTWNALNREFIKDKGDLTGQQTAVSEYLELLANARGSGPVDPMRWGQALTRVSRLTEIPIDELHRQFRSKRPSKSFANQTLRPKNDFAVDERLQPDNNSPPAIPVKMGVPIPRERVVAERWILGVLLLEPHRWSDLQVSLAVEDFKDTRHRRIAEVYWDYQRHEGEPVFNEFLGVLKNLNDPELDDVAIHAFEEVERMSTLEVGLEQTLNEAVAYLTQAGLHREQAKLLAELRRTSEDKAPAQDELSLFEQIVKNNQSTNLRRLGPVKRSGS